MIILVEPDQATAASFGQVIDAPVRVVSSLTEAAASVGAEEATLIVLGAGVPMAGVLSFTAEAIDSNAGVAILLIRDTPGARETFAALQAGVSEVIGAGDDDALRTACARLTYVPQAHPFAGKSVAPGRDARLITVFSAKGGSGKTTIATNLAVALRSGGSKQVCLVDLDLEFGDVAIALQLTPSRTLVDALDSDVSNPEGDWVANLLTPFRAGVDCVLAPVEPGDAERIPVELVTAVLENLRRRYDFVVIDTASQFSEHVLAALDMSHHHVLLTTPELPAVKNLSITLDMLDLLSYERGARHVVFNKADDRVGLNAEDIEQAIKCPVAVSVPFSRDVPVSMNLGAPICLAKPDHPVSQVIHHFAVETIVGEHVTSRRRLTRRGPSLRTRSA